MFRGRSYVPARRIDHHDAQLRGSLNINIVNSNPCSCNDFEIFGSCEKLGGDFGLRSNEKRFVTGYYLDQLLGCEAFPLVDVKCSSKKGKAVRREFLWAQDFRSNGMAIGNRHG